MVALANLFDTISIGGNSYTARPNFLNYLFVENPTPIPAMAKLILANMYRPRLPPCSPALGATGSSSMSREGAAPRSTISLT
jgi:hypothetical protein